jgi:hypothetical protein
VYTAWTVCEQNTGDIPDISEVKMWLALVMQYAIRTREFSDTVARLGRHRELDEECLVLLTEINTLCELCKSAQDELHRYVDNVVGSTNAEPVCHGAGDNGNEFWPPPNHPNN